MTARMIKTFSQAIARPLKLIFDSEILDVLMGGLIGHFKDHVTIANTSNIVFCIE